MESDALTLAECEALDYCALCFDAILEHLRLPVPPPLVTVAPDITVKRAPLFVTWKKRSAKSTALTFSGHSSARLRGCIGTFTPRPLASGLRDYAINAAFRDSRFAPVTASEVPLLEVGVSILCRFESCRQWDDWSVGTHGITIEYLDYTATYLPEVASEQGWTHEETVAELLIKAGYRGGLSSRVKQELKVERYESEKAKLSHDQYLQYKAIKAQSQSASAAQQQSKATSHGVKRKIEAGNDDDDNDDDDASD